MKICNYKVNFCFWAKSNANLTINKFKRHSKLASLVRNDIWTLLKIIFKSIEHFWELSNNAWFVEHVFDDLLAVLPLHTVYWGENKTRGGLWWKSRKSCLAHLVIVFSRLLSWFCIASSPLQWSESTLKMWRIVWRSVADSDSGCAESCSSFAPLENTNELLLHHQHSIPVRLLFERCENSAKKQRREELLTPQ